jgi:uncharacterized membrane protein YhaH (DUF805 family)
MSLNFKILYSRVYRELLLYFAAFRNYAVFEGYATRSEYWYFRLLMSWYFRIQPNWSVHGGFYANYGLSSVIYTLALILPGVAVSVRRLHDADQSCWWFYITAIPVIGLMVLLYFALLKSDPAPNQYGRVFRLVLIQGLNDKSSTVAFRSEIKLYFL